MFNFRVGALGALAFAFTLSLNLTANANPVACSGTTLNPASPIDGQTWTITPIADMSAYYCPNPVGQSSSDIATFLKNTFSLASTPTFVSLIDGIASGTGTLDFTNLSGFNVVGIHVGGGEFAFLWNSAITHFIFTDSKNNISNVRVYCSLDSCDTHDSGPGRTPIPGAAFLMGSVLAGGVGFGAWRRRRREKFAA